MASGRSPIFPRRISWITAAFLAAGLLSPGPAASAERRALLVGVGKYDVLPQYLQLKGPANDVDLVARVLKEAGFPRENIVILAEGGSARPTRRAILSALDGLAAGAGKGDYVYLHFSGHGSQQPAVSPQSAAAETDGLDEIFLPADIGEWEDSIAAVEGAITDDEIGVAIAKIRNRGAFVWAVFDSCHSGTMTRGLPPADEDVRQRKVPPGVLGIPESRLAEAASLAATGGETRSRGLPDSGAPEGGPVAEPEKGLGVEPGGYVAFFAAQTTETTPEMRLPAGHPERRVQGLFTFTLMQALAANPDMTYRQLGRQVLQTYASRNRTTHTPLFEGPGLDSPVFGSEPRARERAWRIAKGKGGIGIPAGVLHQLSEGSVLAVYPAPGAGEDELIGYLAVEKAGVLKSSLAPVAFAERPAPDPAQIPDGAYARLVHLRFTPGLSVARPPAGGAPDEIDAKVQRALDEIESARGRDSLGVNLEWAGPGEEADIRLAIDKTRPQGPVLWLLPPSGELVTEGPEKTHSISLTAPDLREKLETSFIRIAKVINLLKLSRRLAAGAKAEKAVLEVSVTRAATGEKQVFGALDTPRFHNGDEVAFRIDNRGADPIDLTLLYVDSDFGIFSLLPATPGEVNRIEAGGHYLLETRVNTETVGLERLIIIAVEAAPNSPMSEFSFLGQDSLPKTRGAAVAGTARGGGSELDEVFRQAGFNAPVSRGLVRKRNKAAVSATMQMFSWYSE